MGEDFLEAVYNVHSLISGIQLCEAPEASPIRGVRHKIVEVAFRCMCAVNLCRGGGRDGFLANCVKLEGMVGRTVCAMRVRRGKLGSGVHLSIEEDKDWSRGAIRYLLSCILSK